VNAEVFCLELIALVASMALATAAETNAVSQFDRFFILPEHPLRLFTFGPAPLRDAAPQRDVKRIEPPAGMKAVHTETQHSSAFELSAVGDGGSFRSYGFTQHELDQFPPLRRTEDLGSRFCESIFQPEEFRVGKTKVACSLLTAIKRKNPLCLLNPIILNVSW
jgi:hypothetical protein